VTDVGLAAPITPARRSSLERPWRLGRARASVVRVTTAVPGRPHRTHAGSIDR
jgi:hypothetical protein